MDDALCVDGGRPHLIDAARVVGGVGHHEQLGAAAELPPQRPRHRRRVLEQLVRELKAPWRRDREKVNASESNAATELKSEIFNLEK